MLRDHLQSRGFNVFMDVEDLKSGRFNEALLNEIDSSTDMIVVLSPGSLDRCFQEGDWLRWEVAHAIARGKNIVTVMLRGFAWPTEPLPEDIQQLPYFQGVEPSHALFGASVDKLATLLKARTSFWRSRHAGLLAAVAAAGCMAVVAALAVWFYRPSQPEGSEAVRGKYLCFAQDDWRKGVPLLAEQPGVLKAAALAEIQSASNQVEVARLWVAAAEKLPAPDKWHCYRRGRYWFRKALESAQARQDSKQIEALNSELSSLPTLKASLKISGQSFHQETLVLRRSSMSWTTHSGVGPYFIRGTAGDLPPLTFAYGKVATRTFEPEEVHKVLPEGIDFSTAKMTRQQLGGKTGRYSVIEFKILEDGAGISVVMREKQNYFDAFTFDVTIEFGQ
ncbi:MAG: toll/interleukin-1 receptor domain-containing protein [Verrucomicrobia bacterium]|nr:toll/interleukin-1 receptor domain-containing protein [Verrucomicrobiota bacterium]